MDRRNLSSLFGPGTPLSIEAGLPDRVLLELLGDPAADRPGAFGEIARRYGSLIWAVCRRGLREPADAEDAFQATLVALLEHPGAARKARSLPAWLYGVAVRVCLKLKRTEGRHRARAARSARPESNRPLADSAWVAAARAFDEELARLPASLRTAYLTCDAATESQPELAARLGWSPGTLSARYSRARRRLEAQLVARNLAPALAGAGVLLSAQATSAVPWRLADAVVPLIQSPVAVPALAPAVLLLAKEGVVMGLSKLKLLALSGVAAVGVGLNVGPALVPPAEAQPPGLGGTRDPLVAPPAAPPPVAEPEPPTVKWEYEFAPLPGKPADAQKLLAQKGASGWEFAGTLSGDTVAVFKRSKPGGVRVAGGVTRRRFTEMQTRLSANGEAMTVPVLREETFADPPPFAPAPASPFVDRPTVPFESPVESPRAIPTAPQAPLPPLSALPRNDRAPRPELGDVVLDLPGDLAGSEEFQKLVAGLLERGPNAGAAPPRWAVVGSKLILIDVDAATVARVRKLIEPFAKADGLLG